MVVFTTLDCSKQKSHASICDYRSGRAHRVVRSTLAGEAAACDQAADSGVYMARFISEVIFGAVDNTARATRRQPCRVPLYICTDSKSLYDSIKQVTPSLGEKRTTIDIFAIKESVADTNGKVMWLPTEYMKADALTKISKALRDEMLIWMMDPYVVLRKEDVEKAFSVEFCLTAY